LQKSGAFAIGRLGEKSRFWGCQKSIISASKVDFEAKESIKKTLRLPNFKGCACKLDFSALNESNIAAYFTGCQIKEPEKLVEVDFLV